MKIVPATISRDIGEDLAELLRMAERHFPEDHPKLLRIWDELEKLGKVDAAMRSVHLIRFYLLLGDKEKAEYWAKNAHKLHASALNVEMARLAMLVNLGYFSESLAPYEYLLNPENGFAGSLLNYPTANGAYHMAAASRAKAEFMNIANLPVDHPEREIAVRIMDVWGDTDSDYASALDIAGEIMRRNKLIMRPFGLITQPVESPRDGSAPYVKVSLELDIDLDQAIDMTCEYADKLALSGKKIPQSLIFEFQNSK